MYDQYFLLPLILITSIGLSSTAFSTDNYGNSAQTSINVTLEKGGDGGGKSGDGNGKGNTKPNGKK